MLLTQSEVVEKMMAAQSPAEIEVARQVRDEWVRDHPDDLIVLDTGELIENMAESLGLPDNRTRLTAAKEAERNRGDSIWKDL